MAYRCLIVNVHDDVEIGLIRNRISVSITEAKKNSYHTVKVIHGWGSTGNGGKNRALIRSMLYRKCNQKEIKHVIFGEHFGPLDESGNVAEHFNAAFLDCQYLTQDTDYKKRNAGITIIVL